MTVRHYSLRRIREMFNNRPEGTLLMVSVQGPGGFEFAGRVLEVNDTITIRTGSGMLVEHIRAEQIDMAEIV